MSTIRDFNTTLNEFLNDILLIFPNNNGIKKQKLQFEYGIKANVYIAYEKLIHNLMKHSNLIVTRNENAIPIVNEIFSDIDLVEMWNSNLITISIKNTIWDYIETLLVIGTHIYVSKSK